MTSKLLCTGQSTATSYHFRSPTDTGWAICTVNECTGELCITSDYGEFSYRWHVGTFGECQTLTKFIANGDVDYLARKLCPPARRQVFSAVKSIAMIRKLLCERRLRDGRMEARARRSCRHVNPERLYKSLARQVWDELGLLEACGNSADLFFERLWDDARLNGIIDGPSEDVMGFDQTHEDKALRELILPALVEACRVAS